MRNLGGVLSSVREMEGRSCYLFDPGGNRLRGRTCTEPSDGRTALKS